MDPAKQGAVSTLNEQLNKVASFSAHALAQGTDLGSINFLESEPLFEQAIALGAEFRALPLDLLPERTLGELLGPFNNLASALEGVKTFSLQGQQNPEAERNRR